MVELIENDIKYSQNLRVFEVFLILGYHTEESVRYSKFYINNNFSPYRIKVSWLAYNEWKKLKIFFTPDEIINNSINEEYHNKLKSNL